MLVRFMSNGIGKLSSVSTTNVCRRAEDVLLNTLEDELHTNIFAGVSRTPS